MNQVYIDKMKEIKNDIIELINFILNQNTNDKEVKLEARRKLKNLKNKIKTEIKKHRNTNKDILKHFYIPALRDIKKELYIRANSNPGQNWVDDLTSAEGELDYYLSQLE